MADDQNRSLIFRVKRIPTYFTIFLLLQSYFFPPLKYSIENQDATGPQCLIASIDRQCYLSFLNLRCCIALRILLNTWGATSDPNDLNAKNVDAACFTSVLTVINIYARLQDRMPGISYEPPMQCLRMSNGLRSIFQMAGKRRLPGVKGPR